MRLLVSPADPVLQEARRDFTLYLRHFFRHPKMGGGVSVRDFATVEYMGRRAGKMIESLFESPSVKNIKLAPGIEEEMVGLGLAHGRRPRCT